jgi:protein-S-isoprenylcysteine O-methyltransferase Ste14
MPNLELKIPPLVILAFAAALMWLAAKVSPAADFSLPGRTIIVTALTAIGVGVALAGVISFRRAKTTVNPLKPDNASALVSSGIYRLTRNPMYLGALIALLGWAVFLANVTAFLGAAFFVIYLNRFQIAPEEKALAARFGPDFAAYRTQVRRWL